MLFARRTPPAPRLATCLLAAFAGTLTALTGGCLHAADTQAYLWKNVQIRGGGFVSGIVFHPSEPNLFYARTDVGGAFRWNATTNTWLPLNDALGRDDSQLTGVVGLAVDPNDPERLYLAAGQYLPSWAAAGAILRSSDRGATWSRTTLTVKLGGNSDGRSTGERLQVDPNDGRILFLGTNQDGLWKSIDRGVTWARVPSFSPTSLTLLLFDEKSGTVGSPTPILYAGVNSTTGPSLHRSTDAGATWSPVAGQPSGLIPAHADFDANRILYVAYGNNLGPNSVTAGSVWKYDSATFVWTNISPPAGQGGYAGLSVDRRHPGTLVVSTIDRWSPRDEIFRSTTGGASWTSLLSGATWDHEGAPYARSLTPHWIGDVKVNPFDSNHALFVTGYGVFSTRNLTAADSGAKPTWIFDNNGLEETVPLALVSPPSGPPLVSALGDIDGFRHASLDTPSPSGRHAPSRGTSTSIDFAQGLNNLMVRTHSGPTRGARSADNGASWTDFATSPATAVANGPGVIAISANGARIVWAPTNSVAYWSADAGASWTAAAGSPGGPNVSLGLVADRMNANRFYLYDPVAGALFRSTNGGASFTRGATGLPTGGVLASLPPSSPQLATTSDLWLAAGSAGLSRSTDGGTSFKKLASVQDAWRVGFGKAAPYRTHPAVFIWSSVDFKVGFYRSDDIGRTWVRINDPQHQFGWINALAGDPRVHGRVYLATGGRGIVYGEIDANPPTPTPTPTPTPINQRIIYDDALAGGWENWSWATTNLNAGAPSPVHDGANAISVSAGAWTALYLHSATPIDTTGHTHLVFWIHGGPGGGQQLRASAHLAGTAQAEVAIPALAAATWVRIAIPLATLGVDNKTNLDGFWIQDRTGTAQPVFYVDDIRFE